MNRKQTLAFLKVVMAFLLLGWVLQQLDWQKILILLPELNLVWAIAAFVLFGIAQLISVLRMNAYYRWHQQPLAYGFSLRLHYVALLYNLLVPGGIGGDAYRIYVLHKRHTYPAKTGIKIQFLTRLNGLLAITIPSLLLLFLLPFAQPIPPILISGAGLMVCAGYSLVVLKLFRAAHTHEIKALPYSLLIQLGNLAAFAALFFAFSQPADKLTIYLLLYLIALVAGMVPITIGGLGLRELVFLYAAQHVALFGLPPIDAELGIVLSLLMFLLTLMHASIGLYFMQRVSRDAACAEM